MISEVIIQYKVTKATSLELFCDPGKFTRYMQLIFFYKIFGIRATAQIQCLIFTLTVVSYQHGSHKYQIRGLKKHQGRSTKVYKRYINKLFDFIILQQQFNCLKCMVYRQTKESWTKWLSKFCISIKSSWQKRDKVVMLLVTRYHQSKW